VTSKKVGKNVKRTGKKIHNKEVAYWKWNTNREWTLGERIDGPVIRLLVTF